MQSIHSSNFLKVNPFLRILFGPPLTIEIPLSGKSFECPSSKYLEILSELQNPQKKEKTFKMVSTLFEMPLKEAEKVVSDLYDNNIIIDKDRSFKELKAVKHWVKRGWLDALHLHLKTRNISFSDDQTDHPEKIAEDFLYKVSQNSPPEFWLNYPGKPSFALSKPLPIAEGIAFSDVLLSRRSNRPWKEKIISENKLSSILHAANIETKRLRVEAEKGWKSNPSIIMNSSFSALETYVLIFNVDGLDKGLYHYDPRNHSLILLKSGNFEQELNSITIGQGRTLGSACTFVLSTIWDRYMYRYRHPRAYRTLLINTAELAQKYILLSTGAGLSTFLTPALQDELADQFFSFNGYDQAALYVVAVG